MWLIRLAMGRPVTIIVAIITLALAAVLAVKTMKVDIFPNLNLPVVYVVQPYGGMDPAQLEAFVVAHYENHFLYISGVDHIESKSIQNVSIMKVVFKPDTDMSEALANVVAQVERSRSKMPPGTVTPFILRFDAGNVPVGYVVLSSKSESVAKIAAYGDERVRPIISTIPGATTTHPFGGNVRTIVITVDPARLRALHLNPDELVNSITTGNMITPSGLVKTGEVQRIANLNSTVQDIHELEKIPLRLGAGATIFLGDVARVEDDMDIPTGWALVNGRRTVFLSISKLAEASTVEVVHNVREALPRMRAVIPEDIEVTFNFDQSIYETEAVSGLVYESVIGATDWTYGSALSTGSQKCRNCRRHYTYRISKRSYRLEYNGPNNKHNDPWWSLPCCWCPCRRSDCSNRKYPYSSGQRRSALRRYSRSLQRSDYSATLSSDVGNLGFSAFFLYGRNDKGIVRTVVTSGRFRNDRFLRTFKHACTGAVRMVVEKPLSKIASRKKQECQLSRKAEAQICG